MRDISRELKGYPPILGLVGPLGCGKTSTADAIADLARGRRLSCAGPIRDMLVALGVEREATMDRARKAAPIDWLHGRTPRSLMLSLGTAWGREHVGPDVWISAALRAAKVGAPSQPVVLDDIRFDNEARAVRAAGGHLLYVHRPGARYTYEHPSECGLSDWDLVDGVVCLDSGQVVFPPLSDGYLPRRPWWANWRLGRAVVARWRRARGAKWSAGSIALRPPTEAASSAVGAWNWLTGDAVANAIDRGRRLGQGMTLS